MCDLHPHFDIFGTVSASFLAGTFTGLKYSY